MTRSRFLPTRSGPEHLRQQEKPLPKHHHKALSDSLAAIKAYSLRADAVWKPVGLIPSIELTEDGGGLAGVLTDLRDSHEERSDALRAEFKRWFVEYDAIILRTISQGTRAFLLRTRDGHHEIPAAQLSQGTLLALCMLTLAYLPEPPPLVCFEEPDRGLHPRLLRDVQDALYRLSYPENYGEEREPVQVVATTHSPYMLDLYRDHPEEIVIAQKVGIEARFERLIDQPNIEEILSGAPLGEVWYTGILGGVPLEK
jgi:predicted ATPase